ncbi:MAG: tRNA 2-thiocytidine biosynthesis protein TtcA [Synergistaceae bacterium]|nr:tRNA 2-thiocytidine biosynthesis protein TtcA [Synergistaceae bacterium]
MGNFTVTPSIRREVGRAIGDFSMLHDGDNVLVGLSGGKDSLLLTLVLAELRLRSPVKFSLSACAVIMDEKVNVTPLQRFCESIGIAFNTIFHPILDIIKNRNERSPCSFCANMRRGVLSGYAQKNKFNILALGHNLDDAVETAYMNLFRAGRFKSFKPKFYQDRTNLWLIRPLIYLRESKIISEAARLEFPILDNSCPYAGATERQRIKELLKMLKSSVPDIHSNTLNALRNLTDNDKWGISNERKRGVFNKFKLQNTGAKTRS